MAQDEPGMLVESFFEDEELATTALICHFRNRSRMSTGMPSARPFVQGVEGSAWETVYYSCKEVHQAVKSKTFAENKKAMALCLVSERSKRQRRTVGSPGNPVEGADVCSGRLKRNEQICGPVQTSATSGVLRSEAFGSCCSLTCASCVTEHAGSDVF